MDYVKGFGKLGGPNTVNVDLAEGGKQSLETKNIVIATGSEVTPLPPVPVDNAQQKIVDSTGALDLQEVTQIVVELKCQPKFRIPCLTGDRLCSTTPVGISFCRHLTQRFISSH